ncbi:MAG: hypothetical protein KBS97_00845 [Firmicutes bacterium]|nr:hypothetical protein [Candidatus Fiminaster equi]
MVHPWAKGDKGDSGADGISIVGVQLTSSVGLVDTYTITYSNSETSTFTVTNGEKGDKGDAGVSIVSVAFKSSSGLEDTYTITFSDGNTTDFVIKNGEDGEDGDTPEITINEDGYWCVDGTSLGVKAKGDKGDAGDDGVSIVSVVKTSSEGLVDTYTITYSNSETSTFTVTNGEKGEKGDPGETAWSNTILPVTGGYVVPSIGSGVVGEEITFTAFAAEDYTATALLLNGEQVILDENGQYTTTMVEHGFVVQGIFVRSNIVPQGADATEIQEYLDSLEAGSTVKFKYDHVLNKRVTLNKDLTIVGGGVVSGIDKGSFGVAEGVNVTFQGFKFGTFHNDTNNLSPVYAQKLTSKVVFDSCTFDEADWDSIQLVPTASTAEIVIKNCEFNILATQKHVIHIEPTKTGPTDLVGLEIVGNTFNGADAFGGDLICITRVTNINSALKAGDNVFDDELKLQVPPTYEGNVYVADPSGLETTFLVDSLTSEVSDDKQYFSEEIYLPETGDVSALSSFLAKVPEGSTVVFKKSVSLTGGLRIEKDLTVKCANENVVISSEVGSFYVGSENNVVFENMNFGSFTNAKGESSIVYAQQMKGSVVFDSCTFGYAEWDSLQLLPVEDNVSIKITNCVFNINPAQKRAIHIQPNALVNLDELEITGNTFNGADEFGGDLICINKVSNIESVLKVGKNVSDKEFKLQTPPSYEGNVYLADNAQGEVRFKVEALSGAEIVTGADAFAKHGEIEADPLTVDEAYEISDALESQEVTDETYYIDAIVDSIKTEWSSFNNIDLNVKTSDDKTFVLYRVGCTEEQAESIVAGTRVLVKAKITKYYSTCETAAGGEFIKIENELTGIEILGEESIEPTKKSTYTAVPVPSVASLGTVTWSIESGSEYISLPDVTTGPSIEVTGVKKGTAVLKASSGDFSATIKIKIAKIVETEIAFETKADPTGLTSSPAAGAYDTSSGRGAQWSNNTGLVLSTSASYTNISKVTIVTSTNANDDQYEISCTVGGVDFGDPISMKKGNKMELSFEGEEATGAVVITYKLVGAKKSIYVNKIVIATVE